MAEPIITAPSLQVWRTGKTQSLQMFATNTPTGWAGTGLPSGVTIGASTGLVTGDPTVPGEYISDISATNVDGTGTQTVIFGVSGGMGLEAVNADVLGLAMDFDVASGVISFPQISPDSLPRESEITLRSAVEIAALNETLISLKSDDKLNLYVGLVKDGVLRSGDLLSMWLTLKEFEPETAYRISTSTLPVAVGTGTGTRYRLPIELKESVLSSLLANYAEDEGTYFPAKAELSVTMGLDRDEYSGSETSGAFANTGTVDINKTLDFTLLPAVEEDIDYTLELALVFAGRSSQNVAIVHPFSIEFTGGNYVATAGILPAASGVAETNRWRSTLTIESITGDADSMAVVVNLATSEAIEEWVVEIELSGLQLSGDELVNNGNITDDITLRNSGSGDIAVMSLNENDMVSDIAANWDSAASETTALGAFVSGGVLYMRYVAASAVRETENTIGSAGALAATEEVSSAAATITGTLSRAADVSLQTRKSETFHARLERSLD